MRTNFKRRRGNQIIQLLPRRAIATAPGENDGRFQQAHRRNQTSIRVADGFGEDRRIGFPFRDGDDRRTVDDNYAGRPFPS
jgi:hypothetical protein